MVKKRVKKVSKKGVPGEGGVDGNKRKVSFILIRLIFFAILFFISFLLYVFSVEEFYVAMFGLLSILFGVIAMTFLIILLIFLLVKFMRAKN